MNENVSLFRSRFFSLFALRSSFIHSTKLMFALRSSLFALHSFHQAYVRASFRSSLFALLSSTPPSLCSRFFSLFALGSFFITFTQLMFAARSALFLLLLYPAFVFFCLFFFCTSRSTFLISFFYRHNDHLFSPYTPLVSALLAFTIDREMFEPIANVTFRFKNSLHTLFELFFMPLPISILFLKCCVQLSFSHHGLSVFQDFFKQITPVRKKIDPQQ